MDNYQEFKILMKQATQYKKIDINKSIDYIKDAIKVYPSCTLFEGYFRLTKFLALAGRNEEAIQLFNDLIKRYNTNNIPEPFSSHSFIYIELSDFYYRKKDFKMSLNFGFLSFWNILIRTAINGQKDHLETLLSKNYDYTQITKILNKISVIKKDWVYQTLHSFITEYTNNFRVLAKRYNIVLNSDKYINADFVAGESSGQRLYRLLSNDSQFIKSYDIIKKVDFEFFYNQKIVPLLIKENS